MKYKLTSGEPDISNFYSALGVQTVEAVPYGEPTTFEDEETGMLQHTLLENASAIFERNRIKAIDGLRFIAAETVRKYGIPMTNGLDLGSGATGAMVHDILPIDKPSSWVQLELNPAALAENKRRHPVDTIVQGSYHRLSTVLGLNESMDVITGLSSLDATYFLKHTIEEIRRALKPGGYLFHIQDVRPGKGYGFRGLEAMGQRPPYQVDVLSNEQILNYYADQTRYSIGEMFRREIGEAIETTGGMELLENGWVNAMTVDKVRDPIIYYLNIFLQLSGAVHHSTVSSIVTVARKAA